MRLTHKWSPILAVLLAGIGATKPAFSASGVTIYRDRYGVPSIVARDAPGAFYVLGYAMAMDHPERMALNYKMARGRQSEVLGRAKLLEDGLIRAIEIEEKARVTAARLRGEDAAVVRSFCDGANRAYRESKRQIPAWIGPVTPVDVLALAYYINAAFPLMEIAGQLGSPLGLLPPADPAVGSIGTAGIDFRLDPTTRNVLDLGPAARSMFNLGPAARSMFGFDRNHADRADVGSNQFAVSARRSANGHAILSADPHLPWEGVFAWYEFGLYAGGLRFRGISLPGLPLAGMGHTDRVAWCMTNNNPDLYDFYSFETRPGPPEQYNFHGQWRTFEERRLDLRYRDGEAMRSFPVTIRRTAWGPAMPGRSIALKLSTFPVSETLSQPLRMLRARDAVSFRKALAFQGLSMWNIVFADTKGNIGYQFNARVPRRDESFDWSRPVPGSDPKTRWGRFWTAGELPHSMNPKSGLLVNANSSPSLTTLGREIPTSGWPSYVTSYGSTARYRRLAALLSVDRRIAVRAAKRYATDTLVPYAREAIRALATAASGANGEITPEIREAVALLRGWNGRSEVGSKGCALYYHWLLSGRRVPDPLSGRRIPDLVRKAASGTAWSNADATIAISALSQAVEALRRSHGKIDLPWGEMHVSTRGGKSAPVSGFGYVAGDDSAVVPNGGPLVNGMIRCDAGSSFRMIVDLDPARVRSWSALPFGNSTDPRNPHATDQMRLFGRGEYKATRFGQNEAKAGAVSTVRLRR